MAGTKEGRCSHHCKMSSSRYGGGRFSWIRKGNCWLACTSRRRRVARWLHRRGKGVTELLIGMHIPAPPSSQMATSARQGNDTKMEYGHMEYQQCVALNNVWPLPHQNRDQVVLVIGVLAVFWRDFPPATSSESPPSIPRRSTDSLSAPLARAWFARRAAG